MQAGTIILCNDVLGFIISKDDKSYTIHTYDDKDIVLSKKAPITEITNPYALANLIYHKFAKNMEDTNACLS